MKQYKIGKFTIKSEQFFEKYKEFMFKTVVTGFIGVETIDYSINVVGKDEYEIVSKTDKVLNNSQLFMIKNLTKGFVAGWQGANDER